MERYKEVLVEINKLRLGNDNLKYQVNKLVYNGTPNFWDIIEYGTSKNGMDRSAHETRYSRMIRWLMDPGENHNQGIFFVRALIKSVSEQNSELMDIESLFQDN